MGITLARNRLQNLTLWKHLVSISSHSEYQTEKKTRQKNSPHINNENLTSLYKNSQIPFVVKELGKNSVSKITSTKLTIALQTSRIHV